MKETLSKSGFSSVIYLLYALLPCLIIFIFFYLLSIRPDDHFFQNLLFVGIRVVLFLILPLFVSLSLSLIDVKRNSRSTTKNVIYLITAEAISLLVSFYVIASLEHWGDPVEAVYFVVLFTFSIFVNIIIYSIVQNLISKDLIKLKVN